MPICWWLFTYLNYFCDQVNVSMELNCKLLKNHLENTVGYFLSAEINCPSNFTYAKFCPLMVIQRWLHTSPEVQLAIMLMKGGLKNNTEAAKKDGIQSKNIKITAHRHPSH